MLGCVFAGVFLIAGLAWALIAFAGLIFLDLLADLLTERGSHGRAGRSPGA